MPKILQINISANRGSTGRIAEQINVLAKRRGWDTYIAYGGSMNPSQSKKIKIGSRFNLLEHYAEYRLFDKDGLASRLATKQLINRIKQLQPDIIHLHNIHDHWLNYPMLFCFLKNTNIPVVWTQHDCWAYTGGCFYYSRLNCFRWREGGCSSCCPDRTRSLFPLFFEKTAAHYQLKENLLVDMNNLTLVPVSHWLERELKDSFLKGNNIRTICNGVDIITFRYTNPASVVCKYHLENFKYVIAVATSWSQRKGLNDYFELSKLLPSKVKLVLVGLSNSLLKKSREYGIIGIPRTENSQELAALYSGAEIVLNLSYEETFGLTTVEGMACGTPGIVYNVTASPELLTEDTGMIVKAGSIDSVVNAINIMLMKGKPYYSVACRLRAEKYYNMDDRFMDYILLYEELLKHNNFDS